MPPTPLQGRFQGPQHIALLNHLCRSGVSGVLEIQAAPRTAWVSFLQGKITWAETNDPASMAGQVLCDAGLLTPEHLARVEAEVTDEDSLMDRIAEDLARPRSALEVWRLAAARARLAAGVSWGQGTWRMTSVDSATTAGIDPRLFPEFDLVDIGWEAVLTWVDDARARRDVLDPTAGHYLAGQGLEEALLRLKLPPQLQILGARLRAGVEPSALLSELGDRNPELVRILWLLEFGGWVSRSARRSEMSEVEALPAAAPADPAVARVTTLWGARNEADLYDLVGVRPYASTASVARAAADLMRDLSRVAEDGRVPESIRAMARNLQAAAQVAQATLSDDGRRTDYDVERKAGRAGTVGNLLLRFSTTPNRGDAGPLAQALEHAAAGRMPEAAESASRALFLQPDDPDVLSECAWILWNARHEVSLPEDPEVHIHKALSRHPGHARAREVRDLIANQRAAGQGTRRTLMGWLRSKP